jgi:trk system potassium uptake protein TrkA
MKKQDVAIIGLGTFGEELALKLTEMGHNVLVIDLDEKKINEIKDKVTEAVIADATDIDVLNELKLNTFNLVVLAMSSNFESIILTLTLLKKLGAVTVYVKANTDIQAEILLKIGADRVILTDKEVAEDLAIKITLPNIHKVLEIDDKINLIEIKIPPSMNNKTLMELDLRKKYNINALIHKKADGKAHLITDASMQLHEGDILLVAGDKNKIMEAFEQ